MDSKQKVHYIGYNTNYGNPNGFQVFPSCNGKMDYIINSLVREGYSLRLFCLGEGKTFRRSSNLIVSESLKAYYVGTIPNKGLSKVFAKMWLIAQIVFYVLFYVNKKDCVIVYHSTYLAYLFRFILIFKKLNLIYEVEEIYNAAWGNSDKLIDKEIDSLQFADKYIFVNDILSNYFKGKDNFVVCYGDYSVKSIVHTMSRSSESINLVYAGVIGNIDSDIYLAIDSMYYVKDSFHLKIVGYGSDECIRELLLYITKVNSDLNSVRISYDGLLSGEEYTRYLSKCHVGLCPRKLDNKLSNFTFPSKTLVYLTHNLNVITSNINCIEQSKLRNCVTFVKDLSPKGLADAINNNMLMNQNLDILENLDLEFRVELKKLIQL